MRPGIALAGMAALLLAMLGRMGALDWLPEALPTILVVGGAALAVLLCFAVGAALLVIFAVAITAVLEWVLPVPKAPKPGGNEIG